MLAQNPKTTEGKIPLCKRGVLKKYMKTTEKWIYVDEEFEKNYPELYQKIIQIPEFAQYSEKKVEAGISKAGNIKLLWEFNHQTILPKEMLMKSELLYREYLSYISDFGKQLPTNMIQKSRWKEWFDVGTDS